LILFSVLFKYFGNDIRWFEQFFSFIEVSLLLFDLNFSDEFICSFCEEFEVSNSFDDSFNVIDSIELSQTDNWRVSVDLSHAEIFLSEEFSKIASPNNNILGNPAGGLNL